MKSFAPNELDILMFVIITSGLLAGLLAYLMLPSFKRESENCIKSMLVGVVFSVTCTVLLQTIFVALISGIPQELYVLCLWCVTFVPSLILSLFYGIFSRRQKMVRDLFTPEKH